MMACAHCKKVKADEWLPFCNDCWDEWYRCGLCLKIKNKTKGGWDLCDKCGQYYCINCIHCFTCDDCDTHWCEKCHSDKRCIVNIRGTDWEMCKYCYQLR